MGYATGVCAPWMFTQWLMMCFSECIPVVKCCMIVDRWNNTKQSNMLMYSHTINNHLNLGMTKLITTGKIVKVLQNFKYSFKIFFLEISQLKKKHMTWDILILSTGTLVWKIKTPVVCSMRIFPTCLLSHCEKITNSKWTPNSSFPPSWKCPLCYLTCKNR